jgi:hypothetical protein
MKQVSKKQVETLLEKSLNIYHYGSFVYGTFVQDISDYDYVIIVPDECDVYDLEQFECEKCQYNVYTVETWRRMLREHDVCAVETYFLPAKYIVKENIKFDFVVNKEKLRESFSKTASNSYVKCKKKLEIIEDFNPKTAKKSIWHSLRILNFGIQILTSGRILNYSAMNYLYDEIINNPSQNWEDYKIKYKPIYNALKTEFRKVYTNQKE